MLDFCRVNGEIHAMFYSGHELPLLSTTIMKTSFIILVGVSLLSLTAHAQDERKWQNDGTYSVHNYKHHNKATAARRLSIKQGLDVTPPAAVINQVANYKRQIPGLPAVGGVAMPHTPQTNVASRNYKIQRVSHQAPESSTLASEKSQSKLDLGND